MSRPMLLESSLNHKDLAYACLNNYWINLNDNLTLENFFFFSFPIKLSSPSFLLQYFSCRLHTFPLVYAV